MLTFEPSFGVDGGHASCSCGADGLAVDAIGDISRREDAGDACACTPLFRDQVSHRIHFQLAGEQFRIWLMTDPHEDTLGFQDGDGSCPDVLEPHAGDRFFPVFLFPEYFFDHGIPGGG
jgi:hypothetical protein